MNSPDATLLPIQRLLSQMGQSPPTFCTPVPTIVRFAPKATVSRQSAICRYVPFASVAATQKKWALSRLRQATLTEEAAVLIFLNDCEKIFDGCNFGIGLVAVPL